jgi:hypothetical protein
MPERRIALLLRIRRGLTDALTDLAKREHRSLNQQIEFLLEWALSESSNNPVSEKAVRKRPHEETESG